MYANHIQFSFVASLLTIFRTLLMIRLCTPARIIFFGFLGFLVQVLNVFDQAIMLSASSLAKTNSSQVAQGISL